MSKRRLLTLVGTLSFLACLAAGCGGEGGKSAAELRAKLEKSEEQRQSLETQNKQLLEKVTAAIRERDHFEADRDRLRAELASQARDKLRAELAAQEERVRQLEAELEQLRRGDLRSLAPVAAAPPGDSAAVASARERLEQLGALLFNRNEFSTAYAVALSAYELGAARPETIHRIAYCKAAAGDYDAAAEWYERTLGALAEQTPADEELHKKCLSNYAAARMKLDEPEEAAELCRRALELDEKYAPAYFNLGLLYAEELDRPEEAIEALRKHVVYGGTRGFAARALILKLQTAAEEESAAEAAEPAEPEGSAAEESAAEKPATAP